MFERTGKAPPGRAGLPAGIAACLLALAAPQAEADATRFGADAEFVHYTNLNRAALEAEEQSDDALSVEGHAARSFMLSQRSGLLLRGGLRVREFLDFGDLSDLTLSGRLSWRFQPTLGYTSPWFELAAGVDALRHRDSEIRDGHLLSASASMGKYFTDRIRLAVGAGIERRNASEADVYDLSNAKIWGSLDYKLSGRTTLYGSATWMEGEQVFTLANTGPWWNLYSYAKASAADPAFAPAFGGAAPMAYRVDARAVLLELGANFALTGSQAIDLGVGWFDAEADQGGGDYAGATFRVGYIHRFQ